MQYYSILESSSNNGIYAFKLGKLNTGEKHKKSNYLSKTITLIDQNILIAIEQDKKALEITEFLKNTTISPIFYFFERLIQNNASIELLSHDDIPRFNAAYKKISRKINIYKDRSIKNEDFIKGLIEIISPSNIDNNYVYKTQEYLNFFYRKSEEFDFKLSDDSSKEKLFNAVKEYDFSGTSRFVIMITIFSIFSASHDAFFYKTMFPKSKHNESYDKKAKNSLGDLNYLLLMPYLFEQMNIIRNLEFRFITGDKNLSKVISRLKLEIRLLPSVFEYKINALDVKRNLDPKLLDKNNTIYNQIVDFFTSVGIITN